jgi:phage/plasmid-like protein (TIGR03299 family)
MSQETSSWLNTHTLIGFTDKRGHAWHYRAADQGDEPNHYPGPVPVADVERRLFGWDAGSAAVFAEYLTEDGFVRLADGSRQAVVRPAGAFGPGDPGAILGLFKTGYKIHQFRQWLLDTVAAILDADLSIGSAGLLRGGAVAWVSVEVPDTITTPEGVAFRPNLLACTSHDGSLATTYQAVATNVVCDNTMSAALAEDGQRLKVRHSRNSVGRLGQVRDALGIVHTVADEFAAQVAELCRVEVSDADWRRFVNAHAPIPDRMAAPRAKTLAEAKQVTLNRLWNSDARVAPWRGTAWGVVQAVNTYVHHEQTVRGADRAERNMLRAVEGGADTLDRATLTTLRQVLA